MNFDYIYLEEGRRYSFIQIPTQLFFDPEIKKISAEAKILYGLLLSRVGLSRKNNWVDEKGRIYIIYSNLEIQEDLQLSEKTVIKILKELKSIGLLESRRRGLGKSNLIYVKNFIRINEQTFANVEKYKNCKNYSSGTVKNTVQELEKLQSKYIDNIYINNIYNNQSINSNCIYDKSIDEIELVKNLEFKEIKTLIQKKIYYYENNKIVSNYRLTLIDNLVDIISRAIFTKSNIIVNSMLIKFDEFLSIVLKINMAVMLDITEKLISNNTLAIKNHEKYLLSMIFNGCKTADILKAQLENTRYEGSDKLYAGDLKRGLLL